MRTTLVLAVCAVFFWASVGTLLAQPAEIDGILGRQVDIDFATATATPNTGHVGDIFVISVPADNVTDVVTDVLPDQGNAVRRDALVRCSDTIMAFYSAERVGSAVITFKITTVENDKTIVNEKNIGIAVAASPTFSTLYVVELDNPSAKLRIQAKLGDVIEIVKKEAPNVKKLSSAAKDGSILRRDAIVSDMKSYTSFYTVVGKGSTIISTDWITPD
ncbi:MAG TPA: hypothetical protein VFI31_21510, partial [Pirellulales bacterium]|nr:hypothetical protein [Pirellulales bacterium]